MQTITKTRDRLIQRVEKGGSLHSLSDWDSLPRITDLETYIDNSVLPNLRIENVPAKIKGIMKLKGSGQQCTNHVSLSVRCDVPLLGKKVAKFLVEDSRAKIEREYQITRQLL